MRNLLVLSSSVAYEPLAGYKETYLFSDGSGAHYKKWPKRAQLRRAGRRLRFKLFVVVACTLGPRPPAISSSYLVLKQKLIAYGIAEAEVEGYLGWYKVSQDAYFDSPENFDSLVEDFFKSSLFSSKVKELWALTNPRWTAVLRWGGSFLSEVSLLDVINENENINSREFVEALKANKSFTPKVFAAYFTNHTVTLEGQAFALEFTPNSFVTPAWIQAVLAMRLDFEVFDTPLGVAVSEYYREIIAAKVRKAHPEYEGMPDDWTLKLFSS